MSFRKRSFFTNLTLDNYYLEIINPKLFLFTEALFHCYLKKTSHRNLEPIKEIHLNGRNKKEEDLRSYHTKTNAQTRTDLEDELKPIYAACKLIADKTDLIRKTSRSEQRGIL